jgi:hypothetical protein
MPDLVLQARTTALIRIDLQHAIVGRQTAPHSAAALATAFRAKSATTTFSAEAQRFAYDTIFPRLGRVRSTEQVLASLE